jgi:hypothetical protein
LLAAEGKVYGPLSQSWPIANGSLRGTVYYQSYGTNLVKNYDGALGGDGKFGGATLAIKGGSTDPVLVAGANGGAAQCRVCHSVSADGSRMIVQHGDNNYLRASAYDLLKKYEEKPYPENTNGELAFIGLTPDGKLGLKNAGPYHGAGNSTLVRMDTGEEIPSKGLSSFVSQAILPMFSPDGKRVAFNFLAGPGNSQTGIGDGTKLVVMDFDGKDTFSNPQLVYQSFKRPAWPAFWPTGNALLFQVELKINSKGEDFFSRNGAEGELWWVDLASGKARALDILNGKKNGALYLPQGPHNHSDDSRLGYEPTIGPIASGGYAWVVFVSRRLYGNVAVIDPWWSDPREHDLTQTPPTKKLWVAAIDLNPQADSDPSHPPFYLPAQELMAGNTRGFWVADPCKPDGQPCEGGDECCNGYCSLLNAQGQLVCGKGTQTCSQEYEKCQTSEDCCEYPKFKCINGYCSRWTLE